MADFNRLDRREFSVQAALALLGGATITISGCGGGMSPSSAGSMDVSGSISDNHGHSAVIRSAELTAGNGLSLNIQGAADHLHMVELTAADISQIRGGQSVAKQSSTMNAALYGTHVHTVTFVAGGGPGTPGY